MADSPEKKPSYSSLLRNRPFAYLWVAQLVSESGDAVFDIALLWLVFATTGSTALVGLTQAAILAPAVLVSPFAGVYADRSNRRNTMIFSNLVQGAATAVVSVLYLTSHLNFSLLIFLVLMLYSATQFYRAATNAIIPRIVSKESLGAANGLFSLSLSANQLVGYTLGGIVISVLGLDVPITYDSLTFFVAAAVLALVAKTYGQVRSNQAQPDDTPGSFWKDFREGLGYVRQSRFFLELIVFGLVINFFASAIFPLLAPYAKLTLHGDASTYGFITASFALGTILGSVTVGKIDFRRRVGTLVFSGIVVFGVVVAAVGVIRSTPLALAAFLAVGAILAWVNVPINTLIQAKIPGEMMGRATTVLVALISGAQPVASILSGTLAEAFSISSVLFWAGVAIVITTFLLYPLFKELRNASY